MKLTHKAQTVISVIIILLANLITDIFDAWIYRSLGFGICGLIWIFHPLVPSGMEVNKRTIFWTRFGGVILILIGIFTRVHYS